MALSIGERQSKPLRLKAIARLIGLIGLANILDPPFGLVTIEHDKEHCVPAKLVQGCMGSGIWLSAEGALQITQILGSSIASAPTSRRAVPEGKRECSQTPKL